MYPLKKVGCTLWLFNIAMIWMAHRDRWFTWVYPLNMAIFHGKLLNNPRRSAAARRIGGAFVQMPGESPFPRSVGPGPNVDLGGL